MRIPRMKTLRNLALLGAAGTAAAGVGIGLAGFALWRKLGMRGEDVSGQVVLITGSSRGLGLAMAQDFAQLGARLVICARDQRELEWARAELERMGAEVLAVRCDVSSAEDVKGMIEAAVARFGRIDILINNAGIISVGPLATQTLADFQEAMNVMFWGVVYPTLAVLPQMLRRRRGRIANVTSIGGKVSVPHLLPYNCAKFAAVGFSEGLRSELAKDGIKVTTVVPGLMRTGSHVNAFFKGDNRAEFSWFSVSASSPVTAMSGRRAARSIVNAVRRGRSEIILTPQAQLLAAFHGLFPGLTCDILGVVNRILPGTGSTSQERHTGKESESAVSNSLLTKLGRKAGEELHQYPERGEPAQRATGTLGQPRPAPAT
ncbi:MAG: SDR family NAD(P)-dependent oxidoreductase [Terriglobales bacterium]